MMTHRINCHSRGTGIRGKREPRTRVSELKHCPQTASAFRPLRFRSGSVFNFLKLIYLFGIFDQSDELRLLKKQNTIVRNAACGFLAAKIKTELQEVNSFLFEILTLPYTGKCEFIFPYCLIVLFFSLLHLSLYPHILCHVIPQSS